MAAGDLGDGWAWRLATFAAHERDVAGLAEPTVANHHTYLRAFAVWWQATRLGAAPEHAAGGAADPGGVSPR